MGMGPPEETTTRSRPGGETPRLTITFLDDTRVVDAPDSLSFGRAADLIIDDNPSLHRVVGVFFWYDGLWYLGNQASSTALQLVDSDSTSSMRIAPGASASLGFRSGVLKFAVGSANYELDLQTTRERPAMDSPVDLPENAEATHSSEFLPLTAEQKVLVLALAEPTLREGMPTALRTNRQIASGLGWSATKFNRKLDAVCQKLANGGVSGLVGSIDQLARDRRDRLVEYSIDAGLVTANDLVLLDEYRRR